jgi:hypothetical protein
MLARGARLFLTRTALRFSPTGIVLEMHTLAAMLLNADDYGAPPPAVATIYGDDDRHEVGDLEPGTLRDTVERSVLALIDRRFLVVTAGGFRIEAPTLQAELALCPGERFADQPSAAFCTGVLIDEDLVLTAGHCTHVLAREDIAVVFGYAVHDPAADLVVATDDVAQVVEVIDERWDDAGDVPRLDYAWLRIDHTPMARAPAWLRTTPVAAATRPEVIAVGASGGAPLKVDLSARVVDSGAPTYDFFTAEIDAVRGASGGPVLDPRDGAVHGILVRGGPDWIDTVDGCRRAVQLPRAAAQEQATYAFRALEGLCAADPDASSSCRADCGDPCIAVPQEDAADGCAVGPRRPTAWLSLLAWLVAVRRRRSQGRGRATERLAGPRRDRSPVAHRGQAHVELGQAQQERRERGAIAGEPPHRA